MPGALRRPCSSHYRSIEPIYKEQSIQDVTHPDDVPDSVVAIQNLLDGKAQTARLDKRYIPKTLPPVSAFFEVAWSEISGSYMFVGAIEDLSPSLFPKGFGGGWGICADLDFIGRMFQRNGRSSNGTI